MTLIKWLLAAAIMYGAFIALMYVAQRRLMYFPDATRHPPASAGLPSAEEVVLVAADGEKLVAWHVRPRGDKPVVIYFQGNGGGLNLRAWRFRQVIADGTGLIALCYRSYGGSSGPPTGPGLVPDAGAAHGVAARDRPARRHRAWGECLRTAGAG